MNYVKLLNMFAIVLLISYFFVEALTRLVPSLTMIPSWLPIALYGMGWLFAMFYIWFAPIPDSDVKSAKITLLIFYVIVYSWLFVIVLWSFLYFKTGKLMLQLRDAMPIFICSAAYFWKLNKKLSQMNAEKMLRDKRSDS